MPELPVIRDGDVVEAVCPDPANLLPETFEGIAILDPVDGVLRVETEVGVLLPDPRWPVLLLHRCDPECGS